MMSKFFYLLPLLAVVFTACSDDDDDNNNTDLGKDGTLKVSASQIADLPSAGIDEVRLVVYGNRDYTAATSAWDDGFELEFPETVSSTYLASVLDAFWMDDEEYEAVQISDPEVRLANTDIEGYRNNSYIGDIFLYNETSSQDVYVSYYYSDGSLTVKGTYTYEDYGEVYSYVYNVSIGKGWNRIAFINSWNGDNYKCEITTSIPGGVSWIFD